MNLLTDLNSKLTRIEVLSRPLTT